MKGTFLVFWAVFAACQALAAGTSAPAAEAIPFDTAVFRLAPRGWTLRFAPGLQAPRTLAVSTGTGVEWERRMSDALQGTSVVMTVDRQREEVVFSNRDAPPAQVVPTAVSAASEARREEKKAPPPDTVGAVAAAGPLTAAVLAVPAEPNIVITGSTGDTVSQVLKRFLTSQQYTLVWNLGIDLRIAVPYRRAGNDLPELIRQVMEDFALKGTLYPANRVLLVRDPAQRNEEN